MAKKFGKMMSEPMEYDEDQFRAEDMVVESFKKTKHFKHLVEITKKSIKQQREKIKKEIKK